MPTPVDAYRQGYEKGRSDSAGGRLAEMTMGMLRDDPAGHFQKGYSDGAAGKPFNPPSIPTPSRLRTSGLIPKFSENPFGWFLGVLIVIEFWALWQLIKAPFQLLGSLMRSEKPSPSVIVKNVIVAGLAIALVWWVPHVNEMRGPVGYTQAVQPPQAPVSANNPTKRLMGAVAEDRSWEVKNLVTEGANPNGIYEGDPEHSSENGYPFLIVAARYCGEKMVNALLKNGANPTVNDRSGRDAMSYAVEKCKSGPVIDALRQHSATAQPSAVAPDLFTESFTNAPDYSNNWVVAGQSGSFSVTYTPGNFRIQAPPVTINGSGGSGTTLRSKESFAGDIDVSFQLSHGGYGRTQVGLHSVGKDQDVVWSILDTDDTNFLNFVSGGSSTEWKYAGSPYMNKWIVLRIQVEKTQVNFYADGTLLQTWPAPTSSTPDSYNIVFGASSVGWKSGANDTSFRSIQVTGTR